MSDVTESDSRESDDANKPPSINKRQFIRQMAKEADIPLYVAAQAYEAFIKTLFNNVRVGYQVNLTGFGKFFRRYHKGHVMQFGAGERPGYIMLKFSATRKSNDFLDLTGDDAMDARVPGTRVRGSQSVGEALSQQLTEADEASNND
ncbi:MAG: hypothetical protein B5766_05340 [Candidatus Lumbricidophila eiseniae]|uniref:HU domain-containing protein n=1 Tax=Candidatus Lumbricidiphila eiseniae TaxID=1969409 RepID=A0A2A6FS32_9MICO|nr:MAG: hypothetical protein B5766_05340 [Candidatus Lumbricidophila eiseniae]